MSKNPRRKMERKKVLKDSYQQYLLNKKSRTRIEKDNAAMAECQQKFNTVVENFVPAWCHSVANFCLPPKWYTLAAQFVLNKIYGPEHKKLLTQRMMRGKISFYLYSRWIIANILYSLSFNWMNWLKGRFDTLGVGVKVKVLPGGKVSFKVKYWFRVVEEMEIKSH